MLETVTLTPENLGPDGIAAALAAGVSAQAIQDALYICAAFNLIDRVADALGFEVPTSFRKGAASQLHRGYKI